MRFSLALSDEENSNICAIGAHEFSQKVIRPAASTRDGQRGRSLVADLAEPPAQFTTTSGGLYGPTFLDGHSWKGPDWNRVFQDPGRGAVLG